MKTFGLALAMLLLLVSTLAAKRAVAAVPTLGPDCPAGTTIVGSDTAGQLVAGSDHWYTCTLEGLPSQSRACSATNETNGGGWSLAIGTRQLDATSFDIESYISINPGDVISYQCSPF